MSATTIYTQEQRERIEALYKSANEEFPYIEFTKSDLWRFMRENPQMWGETSAYLLDKFRDYLLASGEHEVMA